MCKNGRGATVRPHNPEPHLASPIQYQPRFACPDNPIPREKLILRNPPLPYTIPHPPLKTKVTKRMRMWMASAEE